MLCNVAAAALVSRASDPPHEETPPGGYLAASGDERLTLAFGVARWQGAKLFELRATVSLGHLLAKRDGRDEARSMPAEIHIKT